MPCSSSVWPWAAVLLAAATAASVHAAAGAAKTLRRLHDPIVVSTDRLAALPGRQTRELRLVRIEHGQPVPIPFQFDQRDQRGDLVIDGPPEFAFDDNDELVFMARDTGDRADRDSWPRQCDAAVEIAVVDPIGNECGWAYLLHCPGASPPPATTPYVIYDRAANQARSPSYEIDYAGARNYFTGMRVANSAGIMGANLLRQTKMRGSPTFSLLFTDVTLEFTEQNSIAAIDGVKNGAVRAVRRVRLSVDLGPLFPDLPNGTAYTYHYLTTFVTPTRFGIPGLALRILRDFHFEGVVDFDPRVMPMRYWDAANPAGVALNGPADAPLETAVDHDWWVHSNDAGTVLYALLIPERWRAWGIVRGTVVHSGSDGQQRSAPIYAAGFSLLHMINLHEAGAYDLLQATVVLPHSYRPGDEAEPMAMLAAPLRTEVRRVR